MLAQMAATAGSVAVGSTIGHGLSSMLFGGGGSSHAAEAPAAPPATAQAPINQYSSQGGVSCEVQAKEFTKCLDKADLQSCSWYLEQLKAVSTLSPIYIYGCRALTCIVYVFQCQAAAAPY